MDRIEFLVWSGAARLDQVAAVTFTENAATTMKLRLRERLEAAVGDARVVERDDVGVSQAGDQLGLALEAVPLAVTALLPVVLFPLLGIMAGKTVAPLYFNSVIFLFLGGFMVALALQRWNLHKRIALKIMLLIGTSPARRAAANLRAVNSSLSP